jgi:hypothetical protein
MNERIEELTEQALQLVADEHSRGDVSRLNTDAETVKRFLQEKFAELIIGQCLDIIANADMTRLEGPDPEDVLFVACSQVKEYFGVKE